MSSGRRWWWLTPLCCIGFVVAGVAYLLMTAGWVGPPEPSFGGEVSAYLHDYLGYRRAIFPTEVLANTFVAIGAIGFAVLMWSGPLLGVLRDDHLGKVCSLLAFSGALVFSVTQLGYLGALDSVLEASSAEAFDDRDLATLTQVIDRADDCVESLGMLLIAVALPGARMMPVGGLAVWWRWSTVALAVALVLASVAAFTGGGVWGDVVLALIAIVLVPAVSVVFGAGVRRIR